MLWRGAGKGKVEVLLVHRPRYDDWTFPKGKQDEGESDRQTAVREVEEETGYHPSVGLELPASSYRDKHGRRKTVRYWAMEVASGSFVANDEVDVAEWLGVKAARRKLSYGRDRDVLDAFVEHVPTLLDAG